LILNKTFCSNNFFQKKEIFFFLANFFPKFTQNTRSLSPFDPEGFFKKKPPPLSPLLIQLRTVSKMTAYGIPRPVSNMTVCGERLADDAMGVQGSRARLAGMLAGGVWFRVVHATVIIPADVNASVVYSAVLGRFVRPL